MSNLDVPRRNGRRTFVSALALGIVSTVLVGALLPSTSGAHGKTSHVHGKVNVSDTDGDAIESEAIPDMGLLQAEGSSGAIATRTFAGGGGLLGVGDCTTSTEPAQGPLANVVEVSGGAIVTGIIITGTGTVSVTTAAVGGGQVPVANFTVNNQNPNEFIGLGNGLTVTTPLTFTGVDGTACNFVILGQ